MTTASPISFGTSSFQSGFFSQHAIGRPRSRSNVIRPGLRRQSPLSVLGHGQGFSADAPMMQRISIGDSSDDDDIPVPIMHFNPLTKAILDEKPAPDTQRQESKDYDYDDQHNSGREEAQWTRNSEGTPPSRGKLRITRKSPPPEHQMSEQRAHRVVHLSATRHTPGLRRSLSTREVGSAGKTALNETKDSLTTPANALQKRPTFSRAQSNVSGDVPLSYSSTSASQSAGTRSVEHEYHPTSGQSIREDRANDAIHDSTSRSELGGVGDYVPDSTRIKRANMTRSVRGAPMRRPLRRPADEEDNDSPKEGVESVPRHSPTPHAHESYRAEVKETSLKPATDQVSVNDFAQQYDRVKNRSPAMSTGTDAKSSRGESAGVALDAARLPKAAPLMPARHTVLPDRPAPRPAAEQPVFKIPALPPGLPFMSGQENEPPPTFKRNKPSGTGLLVQSDIKVLPVNASKPLADLSRPKSPPRQALLARSINTPQRAAPPPPKMSVLETATTTAGASTVKSKKKRTHITINGKIFTFRGRLGKGGSSDVYRVMAENDKMFALKKVNLADCSEDVVKGYKGEIELLQKLEDVDRVVKLFDWEVNEAKQSLSVLMEIGESDFNTVLNRQLKPENIAPENVKLDLSFTRYYWREMLCCVAAIHARDIIHSDLKPSNFLLVQGRLKLIDFGISQAIDVEHTVNVHRETNVGTPNYMSPESLIDTNAEQRGPGSAGSNNVPKLMKLGKPCDVWTLGCILYQMTYGRPPFAHIQNTWHRVMSIINPNHTIDFPERGIGGTPIPLSLRDVLRSCLTRDPDKRPTLEQLLDDRERFLNPDREIEKWNRDGAVPVTEHVLEQILSRIVERCRDPKRGIPTDEEVKAYPRAFLERVREMQRA